VRAFIERPQIPFLRSPTGKGVMPDDHPLSVAAARTLALQNADVVFLMGARFNWIFLPGFRRDKLRPGAALRQGYEGHPARYRARGDQPQQGDRGGLGRPTGRAVGPPEDRLWQGDPRLRGDRAIERRRSPGANGSIRRTRRGAR
jgi:hypothetical protein